MVASFLKNAKISKKLGMGFGLVIVILMIVGGEGFFAANSGKDGFTEYRGLALENVAMGRIQGNLLEARIGVKNYIQNGQSKNIDYVNMRIKTALEVAEDAIAKNSDNKKSLEEIIPELKKYNDAFKMITELKSEETVLFDNMLQLGLKIRKSFTAKIQSSANIRIAKAQESLLLGRLYVTRFYSTREEKDIDRALSELGNVLIYASNSDVKEYVQLTHQFKDIVLKSNDIVNNKLDIIGPEIAKQTEDIKLKVKNRQDELGPNLVADFDNAILLVLIFVLVGIALAVIIARSITKSITLPMAKIIDIANDIAKGKLDTKLDIDQKDEIGVLAKAFRTMTGNIQSVVSDVNILTQECADGKLDRRGDISKYSGDYSLLVDSINKTLDAVIQPLNLTAEYIDRISKGDIPNLISDDYKGDFNEIKNNLNLLMSTLNGFVDEMSNMSEQHDLGDIDVAIETSKFAGCYHDMANGINNMVAGHISVKKKAMACVKEFGIGNFDAEIEQFPGKKKFINDIIEELRSNLKGISAELQILINAAEDGQLSKRGDADKFSGDWKMIIRGVNAIFDHILKPLNDAIVVLKGMAEGDLSSKMEGEYKGDHIIMKQALNQTIDLMPFKEAISVLMKFADGDLTVKMDGEYKGESLDLKNALNNTIKSINSLILSVTTTVEEVEKGALQVSDASTALSQGATEQAASLEQITSSMNQIGSQTKFNAENASQANTITNEARDDAESGNHEMQDLTKAMDDITASSNNISKIIKVIEEIAFQTNLLALNAAVEAARAGRHGKGFAVVAEEVRNLAARSATAAKETAELIENSINVVERGSSLAFKTSEALEKIQNGSVKAADIVSEIATSSNEQAQGISQINEGLMQIDKVTQTNTASAEESAAAAEELTGQAKVLKEMIGRFTIDNNQEYDIYHGDNEDKEISTHIESRSLPAKHVSAPEDVISLVD